MKFNEFYKMLFAKNNNIKYKYTDTHTYKGNVNKKRKSTAHTGAQHDGGSWKHFHLKRMKLIKLTVFTLNVRVIHLIADKQPNQVA